MKMFLFLLLLVSGSVFAQATRDIYDLQYLPNKGTLYGGTEVSYSKFSSDFFSGSESMSYSQVVGYSITDELLLSTDLNFEENRDLSNGSRGQGFSDPSLNAKYRLIDNDFRLDVLAGYSLSVGRGEYDNNKNGGDQLTLGLEAGKKLDRLQFSGGFLYLRQFESKEEGGYTNSPDNYYVANLSVLGRLNEKFNLLGRVTGFSSDFFGPNTGMTLLSLSYLAEAQYVLNKDLLLRTNVTYIDYTPDGNPVLQNVTLGIGALYQF